ncbi:hypothetical protein ASG43_15400 [Aureimonas sp. Leaf454]|nr:hypothetical protein ASG43_15400 [Aureimonas sp. Leaf454]
MHRDLRTSKHRVTLRSFSPDEARTWIPHGEEDRFQGPDRIVGMDAGVTPSALEARIALADLYHGVA